MALVAQWRSRRFLPGRMQVRVLPGQLVWINKGVLLGEQRGSNPHAEGSNPSVLAERNGPGTGRRGNRLIRGTRQVRLLPARL